MKNDKQQVIKFKCEALGEDKLSLIKYSGAVSENFIFFRIEFEKIMELCNWSAEISMLQLQRSLSGQAVHYYFSKSYDNVQQALNDMQLHFIGTDAFETYNRKFRQAKQVSNQSVKKFYNYFNTIVQQCNALVPANEDKISEDVQVTTFMDGLLPELLMLTTMHKPKSLSEAFEFAERAEQSIKITTNRLGYQGKKHKRNDNYQSTNSGNKDFIQSNKKGKNKERCPHCNKNHSEDTCWIKYPHLRPAKKQKTEEIAAITEGCRPMLPVRVDNRNTEALLDTGSQSSYISKSFTDYLPKTVMPTNVVSQSVSGHKLNIIGELQVKIQLLGLSPTLHNIITVIVVDNIMTGLILGVLVMAQFQITINLSAYIIECMSFSFSYNNNFTPRSLLCAIEQQEILLLVSQYPDLFEERVGKTAKYEFKLTFKSPIPRFYKKPFRIPFSQLELVKKEVDKLLKYNIIKKQTSAYESSAFTVPKPDNTLRLVVDFSKTLNLYVEKRHFPIPTIDDLLYLIKANMVFTKLDAKSGFFHIGIFEGDQQYTAFSLPFGTFVFLRMPMGISTAPEAFQEFMNLLLGQYDFILVYIDDVLILSRNYQDHYLHVKTVLDIFRENDIVLSKNKCNFGVQELNFLGFMISQTGIQANPEKVEAILKIPPPNSKKKVRSFIGMLQYFRRFIPNMATILAPITDLLADKSIFIWTEECQKAFNQSLELLAEQTLLYYPDFTKPFEVMTDASNRGLGGFVYQLVDGNLNPVYFYSKKFTHQQQRSLSIVEKETFAIVSVLEYLDTLLYGQILHVYCDNQNVMHMSNSKGRVMQRMCSQIQDYSPQIVKIEGKKNCVADLLSRVYEDEPDDDISIQEVFSIEEFPLSEVYIAKEQNLDQECQIYISKLNNTSTVSLTAKQEKTLQYMSIKQLNTTVILYHNDQIVIPNTIQLILLQYAHNLYMHPGQIRMYNTLKDKVYWRTLCRDVKKFCKKCFTCAKSKRNYKQYAKLSATDIQDNVSNFEIIAFDVQGPLPVNFDKQNVEFKNILTIIDIRSRWVELIPLPDTEAATVAEFLDDWWLCRYPRPSTLLSDQGKNLMGKEVRELCDAYGIYHTFTTTYSATANSICERCHETVNQMIRTIGYDNWLSNLQNIAFALRASAHTSLGTSPSMAIYSLDMVLPAFNSIRNLGKSKSGGSVQKDLARLNKSRIEHNYEKQDQVLVRKVKKDIDSKWDQYQDGPFEVIEVHDNIIILYKQCQQMRRASIYICIHYKTCCKVNCRTIRCHANQFRHGINMISL